MYLFLSYVYFTAFNSLRLVLNTGYYFIDVNQWYTQIRRIKYVIKIKILTYTKYS